MDYYLALKQKKNLTHSTIYINVEDVMLNKSQEQEDKYCKIPKVVRRDRK